MSQQDVPKTADGKTDVAALRAEVRNTRAELGQTVEALAAKADVKARLKESAEQTAERVKESAEHAVARVRGSLHEAGDSARRRPVPWLAATGAAAALLVIFVVMRRRRG